MTAERRLDALIGALQEVEPALDDLTRARVGAELQAALRDAVPAPGASSRRARMTRRARVAVTVGGAGLAAAAAALALVSTGGSAGRRPPPPGDEATTATTTAARALAPGETVEVVRGAAERVAIDGAEVTVYGPGRVGTGVAGGAEQLITVDADAVIVDRSAGDAPWALAYGDLDVRVTRAIFALDRTGAPRVTVMRGELLLRCPSGERTVRAGESATCIAPAAPPTAAAAAASPPPASGPVPPPGRPRARATAPSAPAVAEPPPTTDVYAAADAAMRRGDRAAARAVLASVIAERPDAREAAAALLDLARLDAPEDAAAARRHLDALDAHPHGALLAEPAAHLRCTLVAATDHAGRRACLADYYRRFPDSPRAAAALARLAALHAATDCAAAAPLLAEYVTRFPSGPDLAAVVAWRERCAAP